MNNTQAGKKPVIFCDFDGTITESDNVVSIIEHFQPDGWKAILENIATKKVSIKKGVEQLFSLFPSSKQEEIITFVLNQAKVRDGFQQLLDYCQENDIPFFVTSGGIDFILTPLLSGFSLNENQIFCNQSDFSGEVIRIQWPYPCDEECDQDCGMCKSTIIRSFAKDQYNRILIGDSITDFAGAKFCDIIFARSYLIEECKKTGMPYIPFHNFYDVVEQLKDIHA